MICSSQNDVNQVSSKPYEINLVYLLVLQYKSQYFLTVVGSMSTVIVNLLKTHRHDTDFQDQNEKGISILLDLN